MILIIFVVGHDSQPPGAKLFGTVMQMTAFIKWALLVIHCAPYRPFPRPWWLRSAHSCVSPRRSAPLSGSAGRSGSNLPMHPILSPLPNLLCPPPCDPSPSALLTAQDPLPHLEELFEMKRTLEGAVIPSFFYPAPHFPLKLTAPANLLQGHAFKNNCCNKTVKAIVHISAAQQACKDRKRYWQVLKGTDADSDAGRHLGLFFH